MKNTKQLSGYTNGDPIKGAKIKQLGYKTSIHALPDFIRDKIDSFLLVGESPASVIDLLTEKYSKLNLPSQSALYNYKRKFYSPMIQVKMTLKSQCWVFGGYLWA